MFFRNKQPVEIIDVSYISKIEQKNMKRIISRAFSTDDGKMALTYLQYITFHRSLGVAVSNDHLRHMEGQRSLVSTILRLVDQGKQN